LRQLARLVFPLFGFWQGCFALGNAFPVGQLGQIGVELRHVALIFGYIFFSINGVDRALGDANRTVDALVWVDSQKIGAFPEAVYRADVHAVGVFSLDTSFGDGMCHGVR
jgi:hypothetical protein